MFRRYVFLGILQATILLGFGVPAASAQTCAECVDVIGGDWSALDQLDFNGNGFTTFDLIVFRRIQLLTGIDVLTVSDLIELATNQVDITGDGVYDDEDFSRIQTIFFFMSNTGLGSIDITEFIDCARLYILGVCP